MNLIVFLVLAFSIEAQEIPRLITPSSTIRILDISADGVTTIFPVDSQVVFIDSVLIITLENIVERPKYEYSADELTVILETVPTSGSRILIYSRIFPFDIRQSFYLRQKQYFRAEEDTLRDIRNVQTASSISGGRPDGTGLYRSGSLTRAFQVGTNSGLELQSGLKMQVQGKLGREYDLKAVLTDQNTPLQPEGNTRTLNEIDKVYIDISGPRFSSQVGDINVTAENGSFGRYSRKLQGLSAQSQFYGNAVEMTFASTEGEFYSLRINGADGNQGPYFLTGKNGERDIIILSGTEKVYIDGELMHRGEDADYVIDYSSGQITFTRNRLITSYSRITVDFEYSNGRFKKNLVGFGISSSRNKTGLSYSASLLRESDNKDSPQEFSYSESDFHILQEAGDNRLNAYRPGVDFVGEGKGNYDRIITGSDTLYEYNVNGSYRVLFSDVGDGNGDYIFRRLSVYEYAGKGMGRYLPVTLLPVPRSHTMLNTTLAFKDDDELINISGEFARSDLDINTLSNRDDKGNGGNALRMQLDLSPISNTVLGSASFTARIRKTDENFMQIDRVDDVEHDRRWDLENEDISGEQIYEIESVYNPRPSITIKPAVGYLKKGELIESFRQSARMQITPQSENRLDYTIENISSKRNSIENRWIRQKGNFSLPFGAFTPTLTYESEHKKTGEDQYNGFRFDDLGARLAFSKNSIISAYGQYQTRFDKEYKDGSLQPLSTAHDLSFHSEVRAGRRLFSRIHLNRRTRLFDKDNSRSVTDLADVKVQSQELNGGLLSRLDLQVSTEKIPKKERIYIPVEEGRGYYSLDTLTGEYYADQQGDFELRVFTTDLLQGVKRWKYGLNFEVRPARFIEEDDTELRFLREFRTSSMLRYENSESDNTDPSQQNQNKTLLKRLSFMNDLYLWENGSKLNIRFRQNYNFSINNQYLSRSEERTVLEYTLRVRTSLWEKIQLESNTEFNKQEKNIPSSLLDQDIKTLKSDMSISFRTSSTWEFLVKVLGAQQNDDGSNRGIDISYYAVKPGFKRAFLGAGRISGEFQYYNVDAGSLSILPYEYAEGRLPGSSLNWVLNADYQATNNMTVMIRYTGENNKRYDRILHNLRAELQVYF
ncbi:hypothetical protein ACFL67_01265 [candidate division KSB1 bacterium]